MYFADYLQRLRTIVEPKTSIAVFTAKILKLVVTKEAILDYSESSYKGFYNGKTVGKGKGKRVVGDTIHSCAITILSHLDESSTKFSKYMKELQFNTAAKDKLCNSFRDEIPDINAENYPEKLSQLLINILKDAASEPKLISTNDVAFDPADSKSISANNAQNGTKTYNERTIEAVRAIVVELNGLVKDLKNDGIVFALVSNITTDEQKAEESKLLGELQRKFWCKNNELLLYRSSISEIGGLIAHVVELSNQLSFQTMVQFNKDSPPIVVTDGLIDDYEEYLEEIMSVLSTL